MLWIFKQGSGRLETAVGLCLALALSGAPPALAESVQFAVGEDKTLPPLAGTVVESGYILGPGDVLKVADETMGPLGDTIRVLSDGTATLPLIGSVSVGNRTLPEVSRQLNEAYGQYFLKPSVTVQVVSQRPFRVYVTGAVSHPGVYVSGKNYNPANATSMELGETNAQQVHYRLHLSEALMMAGGIGLNANVREITVKRRYPVEETLRVDLWKLFESGDVSQDLTLQDQDVVEVPEIPREQIVLDKNWENLVQSNLSANAFSVNVLGAVGKPGVYALKSNDSVVAAIANAGGFSNVANRKKVYIIRANSAGQVFTRHIDLTDKTLIGKKPLENWGKLLPGDIVFVDDATERKAMEFSNRFLNNASAAILFPLFNRLITPTPKLDDD